jgi:hypothetical protein
VEPLAGQAQQNDWVVVFQGAIEQPSVERRRVLAVRSAIPKVQANNVA